MELYLEPDIRNKRDAKGRFLKGQPTWNKGMRQKGLFFNDTQFKSGHTPHNTKQDYYVSVREDSRGIPYKWIKIPGRKFVPMHRWVYETAYGTIPAGFIVRFKDNDTLNCVPENLELVTRSQHMQRNQNREKASVTMRELWKRERIRKILELKPLTKLGYGRKKRNPAPTVG